MRRREREAPDLTFNILLCQIIQDHGGARYLIGNPSPLTEDRTLVLYVAMRSRGCEWTASNAVLGGDAGVLPEE